MQNVLIFIFTSFCVALISYTYSYILTQGGMLLDFLYKYLQIELEEKHEKLFNVLINCPKCVSGQWALWVFFFLPFYSTYNFMYAVILHILFITATIWFSIIINKIYLWLTN